MKKSRFLLIAIPILIAVCLFAYFIVYPDLDSHIIPSDWQEVVMEGFGTIKVPKEWSCSVEDGFVYLFVDDNGNRKDVLVQYNGENNVNNYFSDIEIIRTVQGGIVYSNGQGFSKKEIRYKDGSCQEVFVLDFVRDTDLKQVYFYCFDSSITKSTISKIAQSYNKYD